LGRGVTLSENPRDKSVIPDNKGSSSLKIPSTPQESENVTLALHILAVTHHGNATYMFLLFSTHCSVEGAVLVSHSSKSPFVFLRD